MTHDNSIYQGKNHLVLEIATLGNLPFSIGAAAFTENSLVSFAKSSSMIPSNDQFYYFHKDVEPYIEVLNDSKTKVEDKDSIINMFSGKISLSELAIQLENFVELVNPDYIWTSSVNKLASVLRAISPNSVVLDYIEHGKVLDIASVLNTKFIIDSPLNEELSKSENNLNPLTKSLIESKILLSFITNQIKLDKNDVVYRLSVKNNVSSITEKLLEYSREEKRDNVSL